jgi:hypothetical protein
LGNPHTERKGEKRETRKRREKEQPQAPDKPAAAFENRRCRIIFQRLSFCPLLPSATLIPDEGR